MLTKQRIFGIDYGSKLAGSTAIAFQVNGSLCVFQSSKGQDADSFLLDLLKNVEPGIIGFDAPLSLPGQYTGIPGCHDFFFRECDRILKAMSPLFLGGLTARAMRLSKILENYGHRVIETWPSVWAEQLKLKEAGYKKKDPASLSLVTTTLFKKLPIERPQEDLENWHQVDSLLCYWSAYRFASGQSHSYGNPQEGLIFI